MGAKIKKVGIKVDATLIVNIKRNFVQYITTTYKREFREAILDLISKGISPVKGERRFMPYSESYLAAIEADRYPNKSKRPVNLKLTGKMLDSLYIKASGDSVEIGFTDEKADFHNTQGAGKKKAIRRLLPTNGGEVFTKVLDDKVKYALKFSVTQAKKNN